MSVWQPLYLEIDKKECIGNSLARINDNFLSIDTFISELSAGSFSEALLRKSMNLADVQSPTASRLNLGYGTASSKESNLAAKAWVVFNTEGVIINSYNVSSVVTNHAGFFSGHALHYYTINYSAPLSEIGPIMATAARFGVFHAEVAIRSMSYASCSVYTHDIDGQAHGSPSFHYNEPGLSSYVNLVVL